MNRDESAGSATHTAYPCSYLFVPGNRPERFEKACSSGADAVIVDLEDAVPPAQKDAARTAVSEWLSPERPALIRINGDDTEWFREDLELCRMPGVAGIVWPKAERIDSFLLARCTLDERPLLPLIETAQGFANMRVLAAERCVQRFLFGSIDFQLDLGIDGNDEELLYFRSRIVLISRTAGLLAPVDGVSVAIDDLQQVRAETMRSRRLGFGGKLCIHPKQIAVVNECFTPGPEEVAWARRVLEAATAAQGSAATLDGKMIDRPVRLKAERIVCEAERRASARPVATTNAPIK